MRTALRRARAPEPCGPPERRSEGPTLCYLGHVDTVLADASEWTHDPWSGEIADGYVWGRGSLDMKSQVAAEVAAAAGLAREGWRPARGDFWWWPSSTRRPAASWEPSGCARRTPRRCAATCCSTRAEAPTSSWAGQRYYGVCCAEKGVFRFTLTTEGAAGHASMPKLGENALLKLAPVLERLASRQPAFAPTPEPLAFLRGVGEDDVRSSRRARAPGGDRPAPAATARADVRRHFRSHQGLRPRRRSM